MCGICFVVQDGIPMQFNIESFNNDHAQRYEWKMTHEVMIPESIQSALRRRGPDAFGIASLVPLNQSESIMAQISGTVLHIRGDSGIPTQQPILNDNNNLLAWNGEIFGGLENFDDALNDGVQLFQALCAVDSSPEEIRQVISRLEGPFALMFWSSSLQTLFIARDRMGRRSLVIRLNLDEGDNGTVRTREFCVSSVAEAGLVSGSWREFPVSGIFQVSMSQELMNLSLFPWDTFIEPLKREVSEEKSLSVAKLMFQAPSSTLNVISFNVSIQKAPGLGNVEEFLRVLGESVAKRVLAITRIELNHQRDKNAAKIAVLYSGGVDSLLIAALADKYIPKDEPIDLLNLAFGAKPFNAPDRQTGVNGYLALRELNPSRKWRFVEIDLQVEDIDFSRKRVEQLLCPASTVMDFNIGSALWYGAKGAGKIVAAEDTETTPYKYINSRVTRYAEDENMEQKNPADDCESNYFESIPRKEYVSSAKILLSGLGADELLAGYGRHRTAFRKSGLEGLRAETLKDVCRIWRRNLGRDDRLMSDHGREVLFPFLDENFMTYVLSCKLEELVDLSLPPGIGDKKILREAAQALGIDKKFASLEKRAIQFGTKIANKNVAGYVALTDDIKTSEIVQSSDAVQLASTKINKKAKKRQGKPGFE